MVGRCKTQRLVLHRNFEWAVFGLAASDIGHHLLVVTAVHADLRQGEGETELLRYYCQCGSECLTAVFDLCRLAVAYGCGCFNRLVDDQAAGFFTRTYGVMPYRRSEKRLFP